MNKEIITKVRNKCPLIHHVTNQVVMNFTANGLLAFGGSPIMAKAEEEVEEMVSISDGLLLNIGTLLTRDLEAMLLAGKVANKLNVPIVFDPVGIAATSFRAEAAKRILENIQVTVIKGNAGEMAHLIDIPWKTKGVASTGDGNTKELALKVAEKYGTTAIVTGGVDIVSMQNEIYMNDTGHPFLTKITGAGCLLGSIITACLTTDDSLNDQVSTALSFFGLASEHAAKQPHVFSTGTFLPSFIDALSLNFEALERDSL